ncbi:hypothetical protein A7D35_11860 [Xanthomonas arboricola]|nr:hypothetical protein A7D35_11860 [Xanthomonas arboricola]
MRFTVTSGAIDCSDCAVFSLRPAVRCRAQARNDVPASASTATRVRLSTSPLKAAALRFSRCFAQLLRMVLLRPGDDMQLRRCGVVIATTGW